MEKAGTFDVTALNSSVLLTMEYLFFVDDGNLLQYDRYTLQRVADLGICSAGDFVHLNISGKVLLVCSQHYLNMVSRYYMIVLANFIIMSHASDILI